jgi:hypothetical protein
MGDKQLPKKCAIIPRYLTQGYNMFGFTPEAEILNGRLAMLGFVIAVGTYVTTGQILPGVF